VRVYGPQFKLAVMRCVEHRISFTMYPPGWTPYGRKQLVHLDHHGQTIEHDNALEPWKDTLFAAVIDGSEDLRWPEEKTLGPGEERGGGFNTLKTQRRCIAGAVRLFALNRDANRRDQERVALCLRIDLADLTGGAKRIRAGPGLFSRAKDGAAVLQKLTVRKQCLTEILSLGQACGFWGPPPMPPR
jgi:hypothetical protein